MDDKDLHEWLAAALRHQNDDLDERERQYVGLTAMFEELLALLIARGALTEGHRKHLERAAEAARRAREPRVRLRVLVDKYKLGSADIDCEALIPLCHARCCAFSFELSAQDLDEGRVRWELERPYLIRHEADGYCTHIDRVRGGGCSVYAFRPATCRSFDCRNDSRVWIDFEKRIPAPMPEGLSPLCRP